jgi:hypothetical protein
VLIRLLPEFLIETDEIVRVDATSEESIALTMKDRERVGLKVSIGELGGMVKLLMLDSTRGVPASAIRSVMKRSNGTATVQTTDGAVLPTHLRFDAVVAALL